MVDGQVTTWQLPRLLLELVPETASLIAKEAVKAWDISKDAKADRDECDYDQLLAKIGSNLRGKFYPYGLAGWIFLPVFEAALDAEPLDEDLVRRCCDFVEQALSGEEYAAEGVEMMVVENFGADHTRRVLPFAGPAFRSALRSAGWIT
jgi:hypothetical protein